MRLSARSGWRLVVGAGLALALSAPLLAGPRGAALAPGDRAPALSGVTFPARQLYEADWGANQLTLVNFWATWCQPCRDEMPLLEALYTRLQDRGFAVVGAFERGEEDKIPEFLKATPVSYPTIRPDAVVDHYWGGIAIKPTSFLVDSEGRIRRKYVGATSAQTDGLIADVEAALAGEPMPPQVWPEEPALPEVLRKRMLREGRSRAEER